jgi:hypothetical protein
MEGLESRRRSATRPRISCAGTLVVSPKPRTTEASMSILWIILIVVLVLALLGFFSRGAW